MYPHIITMRTYNCINTKSIYDLIPEVEPTGEYDGLYHQLLLEEEHSGKMGSSYRSASNYWQLSGRKFLLELDQKKTELTALKARIKTIQDEIQKDPPKEKKELEKFEKKKREGQAALDPLYMERFALETKIKELEAIALQIHILDEEVDMFHTSLRVVIRMYKENKNKEFLRKGVHQVCKISNDRIGKKREETIRIILLDEIGDITEFKRMFDLNTCPMYQLYHLYDIYKDAKKPENKYTKYFTEATMFLVERLTEVQKYIPLTSQYMQQEETSSSSEPTWRTGTEQQIEEETVSEAKKNEMRDNNIEWTSQAEVDYYVAKSGGKGWD